MSLNNPDAEREAKLLIEKIRAQHSLEGHDELAVQVQDLLHLAASELYDASTHFLLELLQNADDNEYQTAIPTLTFTYETGSLRVDCNETGFRAKHVESISKVRRSTKSGQKHLNDYTGEKGIGFKSVFRVADQVWISSHQYRFKFDKTEQFGMIAPRWSDFPGPTSPEETSFYLKFSKHYNEDELVDELQNFDPTLLVFLKRLQKVTLRVLKEAEKPWEEYIYKTTTCVDGNVVTTLNTSNSQLRFLTIDYRVENLPVEPKRRSLSYSKIVLAFPFADLFKKPQPTRYKVYALLPIGNYGLKFLMNADFLLTANRLHIDVSLPWNQALRDGLAHAFIQAVNHFNEGKMRYYWPYFIPTSDVSSFFQPARHLILQTLRDNEFVESAAGALCRPTSLLYVHPSRYTDEDGSPLTLNTQTRNKYLSSSFPPWTTGSLLDLGVRELTDGLFLDDLESMLAATPEEIQRKPSKWHAQLAKALLHMADDPSSKERLLTLPIVPLRSGGWTTAKQKPVLFSVTLNAANFPIDATFQIVDPEAAAETHRRRLFERLEILEVDAPRMCRYIADAHASPSFEPYKLSKEELVSHVEFLYKTSWFPPDDTSVDLWFITSDGGRYKGSQLYIQEDFPKESPRANVLEKFKEMFSAIETAQTDRPRLRVIHQDYLSQSPNLGGLDMDFYLIKILHLSKIPRLVSFPNHYSEFEFEISGEFKFLLRECPVLDIIGLLYFYWETYSPWIEERVGGCSLIQNIRESIVQTPNGPSPLSETFAPMLDIRVSELGIPIPTLDIPNPKDRTLHRILVIFGVKVEIDVEFYIACLKSIRKHHTPPKHETISYIYEQIQFLCRGSKKEMIECEFNDDNLIYDAASKCWFSALECVAKEIDLKCMYPRCKYLFLDVVVPPHLIKDEYLVERVKSINMSSNLSDILDILVAINKKLQYLDTSMIERLHYCARNLAIFPIKKNLNNHNFDGLLSCNDTWFIADRPHLARSFDGIIPLLAFHAQDVHDLEELFKTLGLNSRRLSENITKTLEPSGNFMVSDRDTYFFRSRSAAFKALITKSNPRHAEKCRQLDNVSVVWVTSLYQLCTLKYKSEPNRIGQPLRVEYALESKHELDGLTIFTTHTRDIHRTAPAELVELLAIYCDIDDLTAQSLLYTAISEPKCDRVRNRFEVAGYHIHLTDNPRKKRGNKLRSGDLIMIPSTFSDVDTDDGFGDDFDDSQNVHIEKDAKFANSDRRVPPMDIRNVQTKIPEDPINPLGIFLEGAHMDPSRHLEYLGQCMTSQFFKSAIEGVYDPVHHWTSDLRIRAGFPSFVEKDVSPFTIKDQAALRDMTSLLISIGHQHLQLREVPPAYHFEIAVSSGDMNSPFIWSSSQLRRMQIFQSSKTLQFGTFPLSNPDDIMILVRVINIYTHPQIRFVFDPWCLLTSQSLIIQNGLRFEATIQDSETGFFAPGLEMQPFFKPIRAQYQQEWTYTYKSLKDGEVRLFILFPGKKYDRLKGAIFTCPTIEDAKTAPYRTLSYEWGSDQQSNMPLFTHEGVINLRTTLHTMLRHLRQESSPVILWVDAICINQGDPEEKAQQILLLPRIFQNAACTLAFLSAEGHFDEAIKTLLRIRAWNLYGPCSEKWPESLLPIPVSWAPHSNDVIWEAIGRFFTQTWFRRIWIVQEVTLAPTVRIVCGTWIVDWREVYEAVVALQRETQLSVALFNSWKPFMTLSHMRGWEVRRSRWNMLKLLNTFSYADSTLKRDRFFSLLGLASDGNLEAFQPDYRANITFESIACRFGNTFIAQGYGIQLLYQAGLSSQPDRFPSWLPDLTVPRTNNLLRCREQGAEYRASADKLEEIHCFPPRLLAVKGYLVDEIDQISRSTNNRSVEARLEYFHEIEQMVDDMAEIYSSINPWELTCQVPIAGAKHPKMAGSGCIDIATLYLAFRKHLANEDFQKERYHRQSEMADSNRDAIQQGQSMGYASLLDDNLLGWRFVTTKGNLFGIVPGNARVGDLVSIINGADVPFLLRKPDDQKDTLQYRLIGGCYIHGIMLGEALENPSAKEEMIHIY